MEALPITTSYHKAWPKYFPVLLCTTKLAQSTSQDYFVLQSLHQHFPVPLRTAKLAQSTSQYYFVLQNLHTKHFPALLRTTKLAPTFSSTTSYCKACTKYFPVLLCTTKLAQTLPSTTLYYKACTKYFPVPLFATKLARRSDSQYYFVLQSLHREAFTQKNFYTLRGFTQTRLYTETIWDNFTHRNFCRQTLLHTVSFLHTHIFLTHSELWHRETLTQRSFCTHKTFSHSNFLHTETFTRSKFLHKEACTHSNARQAFTHSFFNTKNIKKLLHRSFTQSTFADSKFLHTETFTRRNFYTQMSQKLLHRGVFYTEAFTRNGDRNCRSKAWPRRQHGKKRRFWSTF